MRNFVQWIDNKSTIVHAANEIKQTIQTILKDGIFLENMVKTVKTSQDFINASKSLMSIQRKISETIHSIQDFSISSSRTVGLEIGSLRIFIPFWNWVPSHNKLLLQSVLDDLEAVISKCISLQNDLLNLNTVHSPEEINLIDLSNQSEWSPEIMKEVMDIIKLTVEENQDSVFILRYVMEWDYEKRFTVGQCDSETSPVRIIPDCFARGSENQFPFLRNNSNPKILNQRLKRPILALTLFASVSLVSIMYTFGNNMYI